MQCERRGGSRGTRATGRMEDRFGRKLGTQFKRLSQRARETPQRLSRVASGNTSLEVEERGPKLKTMNVEVSSKRKKIANSQSWEARSPWGREGEC